MNAKVMSIISVVVAILVVIAIILLFVFGMKDFGYDDNGKLLPTVDISSQQKSNRTWFYVMAVITGILALMLLVFPVLTMISIPAESPVTTAPVVAITKY